MRFCLSQLRQGRLRPERRLRALSTWQPPVAAWPTVHLQSLDLGIVQCGMATQLAADPTFTEAAERQLGETFHEGIQPDRAGANAGGRGLAGVVVAAPDAGRQAVASA